MVERGGIAGLNQQVCLVTGASQGIGFAVARELARWGARLVLTSQEHSRAVARANELAAEFGCETFGIDLDVTDPTSVARLPTIIDERFGAPVSALVNNAGLPVVDELWNTQLHEIPMLELVPHFRRVADVDLAGARAVTRALLPSMMQERRGSIVFISSTPALSGCHAATPYTEAKAAILGLMRDISFNYAPYGIRANAVAPGSIQTRWFDALSAEEQQALAKEAPLGRWGTAEDVAGAVVFFASPQSSFVTGQTLVVDGGKVVH